MSSIIIPSLGLNTLLITFPILLYAEDLLTSFWLILILLWISLKETKPFPTADRKESWLLYPKILNELRYSFFKLYILRRRSVFKSNCLPKAILSFKLVSFKNLLIAFLALLVTANFCQLILGVCFFPVIISITSPLFNSSFKDTKRWLTLAPKQCKPTWVWTWNAKSTGVDPIGNWIKSPVGVKT